MSIIKYHIIDIILNDFMKEKESTKNPIYVVKFEKKKNCLISEKLKLYFSYNFAHFEIFLVAYIY